MPKKPSTPPSPESQLQLRKAELPPKGGLKPVTKFSELSSDCQDDLKRWWINGDDLPSAQAILIEHGFSCRYLSKVPNWCETAWPEIERCEDDPDEIPGAPSFIRAAKLLAHKALTMVRLIDVDAKPSIKKANEVASMLQKVSGIWMNFERLQMDKVKTERYKTALANEMREELKKGLRISGIKNPELLRQLTEELDAMDMDQVVAGTIGEEDDELTNNTMN